MFSYIQSSTNYWPSSKSAGVVNIQNCQVAGGDISTLYSTTVKIWNCTVEVGEIWSYFASAFTMENGRVAGGGIFLTDVAMVL